MLQDQGGENKRKHARVDINLPVVVVARKGRYKATLVNVSLGGCQLEGGLPARVGEILAVSCLDKPGAREDFQTRVVWAVPKDEVVSYGGMFWRADENAKRELLQGIVELAKPGDPMAARLLLD
jgi:hypothetical protein